MASRTLINMQPLPPRAKTLDRAQVETDIREAMARSERRLYDQAVKYSVGGYTYGEPEFTVESHIIIGKLRLERKD